MAVSHSCGAITILQYGSLSELFASSAYGGCLNTAVRARRNDTRQCREGASAGLAARGDVGRHHARARIGRGFTARRAPLLSLGWINVAACHWRFAPPSRKKKLAARGTRLEFCSLANASASVGPSDA